MHINQYSITELAELVNAWCRDQQVQPLHNHVGTEVTVRNIRYYQGLGLVDRPLKANGHGFGDKHRLQLVAIRLLQARGLSLERIRGQLLGKTEEELREMERRGVSELAELPPAQPSMAPDWRVTLINENILLLMRTGKPVTAAQRLKIAELLEPVEDRAPAMDNEEGFRPEID